MHSYEEKMRAVELYLKYDLSAASVINELEQHIKKNKLPAKDQRVIPSHNNYIMVVVRLSATILHLRKQSKVDVSISVAVACSKMFSEIAMKPACFVDCGLARVDVLQE